MVTQNCVSTCLLRRTTAGAAAHAAHKRACAAAQTWVKAAPAEKRAACSVLWLLRDEPIGGDDTDVMVSRLIRGLFVAQQPAPQTKSPKSPQRIRSPLQ